MLKPRIQFEQEMIAKGEYLFVAPTEYDSAVVSKRWKPTLQPFFSSLLSAWEEVKTFDATEAEQTFKHTAEKNNLKPGEVLQLTRVFVSGQAQGVDLFPMIALLGKAEVIQRMNTALSRMS